MYAYGKAGITLPRTSSAQSTFGKAVSRSQLQPGDLVFFGSPVHHVGIYLGDGKMVHAPDTGDVVKISPLQNDYSGARRVAY
jgi:cell wall-associated NlpC family hydrolase